MIKKEKQKSELQEARLQYLLLERGFNVSKPFGDSCKYDFISDKDNILKRIQIKSTSSARKVGEYQIKASYGAKVSRTKYTKKDIDILIAHITPLDLYYIIPIENIDGSIIDVFPEKINSKAKYESFKERWDLLLET